MSCAALYIRYTPGRRGRELTNSLASKTLAFIAWIDLEVRQLASACHHLLEHFRRQHPGRGVVATAMIRVDQTAVRIQCVFPPVREGVLASLQALREQEGIMSYAPQGEHHSGRLQRRELCLEVGITAPDLIRQG